MVSPTSSLQERLSHDRCLTAHRWGGGASQGPTHGASRVESNPFGPHREAHTSQKVQPIESQPTKARQTVSGTVLCLFAVRTSRMRPLHACAHSTRELRPVAVQRARTLSKGSAQTGERRARGLGWGSTHGEEGMRPREGGALGSGRAENICYTCQRAGLGAKAVQPLGSSRRLWERGRSCRLLGCNQDRREIPGARWETRGRRTAGDGSFVQT